MPKNNASPRPAPVAPQNSQPVKPADRASRVRDAFKPRGFPIIADADPAPALDDAAPCPAPTARS